MSPDVGELDEEAFENLMADDPDAALELLAEMTGATDVRLRELARRLAGRVVLDVARAGRPRRRGVGRMRTLPFDGPDADLDVDASLDALVTARAGGRPPALDDLSVRAWSRPEVTIAVVIDRSGSMGGERLASAAIAASACAWRAPDDYSVLCFADRVTVVKGQDVARSVEAVVDDVFSLRGHGTTDLSLGLGAAQRQLSRSTAQRRITLLLSDCKWNCGDDPVRTAAALDELVILSPAGDDEEAQRFAATARARCVQLAGPSAVPSAIASALGP